MPVESRPVLGLELIACDFDDVVVYRERDNIDVLIEFPSIKFVVAIENKVGGKAGVGQLERYNEQLKASYPEHRRLMVFLTPESAAPDHESYVGFGYAEVISTLEGLISDPLAVPPETKLIVSHYVNMVRRHIVPNEKLRALAVTLYERHKEAFEFIFECRPEPYSLLGVARGSVQNVGGLILEPGSSSSFFRFVPEAWDQQLKVIKGDAAKWTKTGRGLLFEVKIYPTTHPGRVNVSLILGPGEAAMRTKIYEAAAAENGLFKGLVKPMGAQLATIFSRDLLTVNEAKGQAFEAQEFAVRAAWSDFQARQLPSLIEAILKIDRQLAADH